MGAIDLRGRTPVATYQNIVTTDGTLLSDGSGSQIRFLNITASFAQSASVQTTAEVSSSFASSSLSSSVSISSSYALTSSFASNVSSTSSFSISSSYALTSSFANSSSNSTTASFATTSSFASTIPQNIYFNSVTASAYAISQSIFTSQLNSYTITNNDDGHLVVVNSGSSVTVTVTTSSISPAFSAMYYQSGSGKISFTTASTAVFLKNRSNFSSSAGQYSIVSLLRVPNGDFVLGGDLA